jgi:hypothetical protein
VRDDTALAASYHYNIDTVPTLIRLLDGKEDRVVGWRRAEWEAFTGIDGLGEGLPDYRPGCGSKTVDFGMPVRHKMKYGNTGLASRRIGVPGLSDPVETCYERGWTDGLPVVPPACWKCWTARRARRNATSWSRASLTEAPARRAVCMTSGGLNSSASSPSA